MVNVQKIDIASLEKIYRDSDIVADAKRGPKVLKTKQNDMIKCFVPRKMISSSLFFPYAVRFARNSRRLQEIGVETVNVQQVMYCKERKTHLVVYPEVPGQEVREVLKSQLSEIIHKVCQTLAMLHQKGVFFRGIHLGNLLVKSDGKLCLIDIANLKVFSQGLSLWHRARNLRHLLACRDDQAALHEYGVLRFLDVYLAQTQLMDWQKKWLKFLVIGKGD